MKGIKVSDFIRPVSLNDEYPTHVDTFGQGGLHSVNTLEERNNISKQRRKEGMLVFVRENGRFFYLLNGIANSNWTELTEVIYTGFRLLENYILIGNEIGLAYQSPLLLYLKNDFLKLKKDVDDLNYLDYGAINLGNKYNLPKPIKLGAATFPLPDTAITSLIKDIPIPNPTFNPVSLGDWIMSGPWLPQIFAGSIDADLSNPLATVSSSLAMTQIRTAKNFKLFDNANFIVANKNVSFLWDNPAYLLANISPNLAKILSLYDLGTSYTFTKAQSLGELETGLLKNTVNNGTGTLSKAISGEDYVNTADIPIGNLVILDPLYPLTGHKLIAPTDFSTRKNEPNEFGYPANTIDILMGKAAKFKKFAITGLTADLLIKVDQYGEVKSATPDIDYTTPSLVKDVISTLSTLKTAYELFSTATQTTDIKQDVEITLIQAKDVAQDTAITTAQSTATSAQATATAAETTAGTALTTATAAEASVVTLGATVEAEIVAIWTELNAVGIVAGGSSIIGGLDAFFNLFKSVPKGDKGDTGATGPKGDKGDQGEKGEKGDPAHDISLDMKGDVIASGYFNGTITSYFIPNPRFTGKEYIKIPVGNTLERPRDLEVGMIRFNKEL